MGYSIVRVGRARAALYPVAFKMLLILAMLKIPPAPL